MAEESTVIEAPAIERQTSTEINRATAARFDETFGKAKGEAPARVEETKPAAVEPVKPAKVEVQKEGVPDHLLTGDKAKIAVVEDDILKAEPPKDLSAKAKDNWRKLQESSAKRIADLEAKIQAQAAAPAAGDTTDWKAKLEAVEARAAELEQRVERTDFEKSPRFQQQFTSKEQAALKDAVGYLEGSDVNPNIIDLAARATGSARIKLLSEAGIDGALLSAIMPSLRAYDDIQREKGAALENWKGTAAQWQKDQDHQKTQQEAQSRAQEERVFTEVGQKVAQNFEVYQKVDGHDGWNRQVDEISAEVKRFASGEMPLEQIAEIVHYGVGAKHLHAMFHTLQGKFREAQTELTALKSASPGGGNANGSTGKVEDPTSKLPLKEGAAARFDQRMGR